MSNVISFCLFSDSSGYVKGFFHNLYLAPILYPGWEVWLYHDKRLSWSFRKMLPLEIKRFNGPEDINPYLWRYLPLRDPTVERTIIRDCDSELTIRERFCVEEWIDDDTTAHTIRDNVGHGWKMMGGLSGFKHFPNFDFFYAPTPNDRYICERYLRDVLYSQLINDLTVHCSIPEYRYETFAKEIKVSLGGDRFCGQINWNHRT